MTEMECRRLWVHVNSQEENMSMNLKLLIVVASLYFGAMSVEAKDAYESELLLRSALMQSNGDYNKLKKIQNEEEYERENRWNQRGTKSIVLGEREAAETKSAADLRDIEEEFQYDTRGLSSDDKL